MMAEITAAEAAAIIGVDASQVRRLLESGVLRGRLVNPRMWMVERRSVVSYAAKAPPTRGWKRGRPRTAAEKGGAPEHDQKASGDGE